MTQLEKLIEKEYHGTVEWAMCYKTPGSNKYEIMENSFPYWYNTEGMEIYMIKVRMQATIKKDMSIEYAMYICHPEEVIKMYTIIEPRKKRIYNDTEI